MTTGAAYIVAPPPNAATELSLLAGQVGDRASLLQHAMTRPGSQVHLLRRRAHKVAAT